MRISRKVNGFVLVVVCEARIWNIFDHLFRMKLFRLSNVRMPKSGNFIPSGDLDDFQWVQRYQ